MDSHTHFVVTPWRNSQELVQLRRDLYRLDDDNVDRRQSAVNKVLAWRARKESLPLLLDSTADIVDVILQDEKGDLKHNACRLLYATAISRFITGYLDTQIDLTRDRPSWFPSGKSLLPPSSLLEVRHCIVHRHMPSLAELKRAVQQALNWLWEWYWSHLEAAFSLPTSAVRDEAGDGGTLEAVQEKLQTILRAYVKARKSEIKTKRRPDLCTAARNSLSTYNLRFSSGATTLPSNATQNALLQLFVQGRQILPQDKRIGSSMSGAFLIWSPLLLEFCVKNPLFFQSLLDKVMEGMSDTDTKDEEREGLCDWAAYLLCSSEWAGVRGRKERGLREKVLGECLSELGVWNLALAQKIVHSMGSEGEMWQMVLEAARSETGDSMMEINKVEGVEKGVVIEDVAESRSPEAVRGGSAKAVMVEAAAVKGKVKGPQKVVGLWKPKPIGWLPEGWDEDA